MKTKTTLAARLEHKKSHIRKLTYILKSMKEMVREGIYCEEDIESVMDEIRRIREIHKTKIKLQELEHKEAS